jgi:hypothetical protein
LNSRAHSDPKGVGDQKARIERIIQETEENLEGWLNDWDPLVQKIRALDPEGQRVLFGRMLRANEAWFPLVEKLVSQDEPLALSLVESLSQWTSPRAGFLLHRLAASIASKSIHKAIRKSIFRLKSQGISVEPLENSSPAVFRPPLPSPSGGFLGPVDSEGKRVVLLTKSHLPKGILAFTAFISDLGGLVDFWGVETSRKNFQEYIDQWEPDYRENIVEADSVYCRRLVAEAQELASQKGESSLAEFVKWEPFLGPSPGPQKPLIYRYLSEEEIRARPDQLDHVSLLWETSVFANWVLAEEECKKYLAELEEASRSRLVLAPYQKEQRIQEIYRQAVRELFDPPRRTLYRRRLEENAYILWKKGLAPEARICLATALTLEEESGIISSSPFLLDWVERSFH